jgi:DNA-binding beta-propeller fold protein YncE/tRNA A-37 threonylcarbamoyl transferase component Bud32
MVGQSRREGLSVSVDPRIGSELLGYRIEALLGRGGMSVVYRAEDVRLKRKVALKLIAPELAEDERFRERFLRESELAASLDHASIVPIYGAGELDGQLYIAMRYVEGGDLKRLLRSGLEPRRALDLLAQVADALDAAHEAGLVHRDVKPGNVLLDARDHCYLADFGLTRQVSSQSGFTATGEIVGTIDYVAPEVIEGKALDARSDLYSFGCLLYECLSGQPPFHRDSEFAVLWAHINEPPPKLSGRRLELSGQIDAVVAKALAKDPRRRYESARELVETARRALPEPAPQQPRRRGRLLLALVALAATVVLAAVLPLVLAGGGGGPNTRATLFPLVDSVQRIDPATNRLVATLPEGPHGSGGLAVARGALWIAPRESTVLRVDPSSGRTTATIPISGYDLSPGVVGLAFDGERTLWAGSYGVVIPIDPDTARIRALQVRKANLSEGNSLNVVVVGSGSVWADDMTPRGNLLHYDAESGRGTPFFAGSGTPMAMALGFDSLWVAEFNPGQLVRVGTDAANSVLATIQLPFDPAPGGLAAGFGDIWVTNPAGGRLLRVDPNTNRIVQTIRVGRYPTAVASGMGSVWVANNVDGTVSRVDPRSGRVVATTSVGTNPTAVAVGARGVWVAVHPA